MTKKQKELMIALSITLIDINKEAENDKEFSNFIADTFNGLINYSLDDIAMHVFFNTNREV